MSHLLAVGPKTGFQICLCGVREKLHSEAVRHDRAIVAHTFNSREWGQQKKKDPFPEEKAKQIILGGWEMRTFSDSRRGEMFWLVVRKVPRKRFIFSSMFM